MFAARLSDRVLVISGDFLDEHVTAIDTPEGVIVIDTLATLPATRAALPFIRESSDAPASAGWSSSRTTSARPTRTPTSWLGVLRRGSS